MRRSRRRVGYCNEEFDRLTQLGDTTVDPEERIEYYEQAGQILVDDQPGPFLFNLAGVFVVNPTVTGYTPTPSESEWPGQFSSLMTIDKTELDHAREVEPVRRHGRSRRSASAVGNQRLHWSAIVELYVTLARCR